MMPTLQLRCTSLFWFQGAGELGQVFGSELFCFHLFVLQLPRWVIILFLSLTSGWGFPFFFFFVLCFLQSVGFPHHISRVRLIFFFFFFWSRRLVKFFAFFHFCLFFIVSPELSSGRDLVIQMSVRRAACGVRRPPSMFFCPEHISGSVWPTLMIFGMWVGLGLKLRMLNFGRGRCLLST